MLVCRTCKKVLEDTVVLYDKYSRTGMKTIITLLNQRILNKKGVKFFCGSEECLVKYLKKKDRIPNELKERYHD